VTPARRTPVLAVCAAVVLVALVVGVLVWQATGDDEPASPGALDPALATAEPAGAPFEGLTEIELSIGGACRRVAVADDATERGSGLRGIPDPGPYAGMLFVYPTPVQNSYTMSGVTFPLELGFYDDRGRPVDRLHLVPCPQANEECPSYLSRAPYRYGLETYDGDVPSGPIGGCPA
jgi:uncharacterized membrane protein (UPF0127 family)